MVTVSGCEISLSIGVLNWLGFSRPGGAENEHVELAADPLALGQLQYLSPVEATSSREVEVFHRG